MAATIVLTVALCSRGSQVPKTPPLESTTVEADGTTSTTHGNSAGPSSTRMIERLDDRLFANADFNFDAQIRPPPTGAIGGWKPRFSRK